MMSVQAHLLSPAFAEARRPPAPWFMGLGIAMTVLGLVAAANLSLATAGAVYLTGALMLVGGLLQLFHAIGTRRWGWTLFWTSSGLLYVVAAVCVMLDPGFAARLLVLCLAFAVVASGVMRCIVAVGERGHGWGWLLASGAGSTATGAILYLYGGNYAIRALGFVLAVDLLFQGMMLIFIGIMMRRVAHLVQGPP